MERGVEILKNHGIRITQQRLAIYKVLLDKGGHFTAEDIYGKIKADNPAVSLATVYTILEVFKEKGLVNEIRIRFGKSDYEARTEWHHHFLCARCKVIYDIDIELCPSLKKKQVDGHSIERLQGYFYGTGKKCKGK